MTPDKPLSARLDEKAAAARKGLSKRLAKWSRSAAGDSSIPPGVSERLLAYAADARALEAERDRLRDALAQIESECIARSRAGIGLDTKISRIASAALAPRAEREKSPIKCATFDPEAQAAIPPEIRAKMDADRDAAEREDSSDA